MYYNCHFSMFFGQILNENDFSEVQYLYYDVDSIQQKDICPVKLLRQ